jgi:hypothetical protein
LVATWQYVTPPPLNKSHVFLQASPPPLTSPPAQFQLILCMSLHTYHPPPPSLSYIYFSKRHLSHKQPLASISADLPYILYSNYISQNYISFVNGSTAPPPPTRKIRFNSQLFSAILYYAALVELFQLTPSIGSHTFFTHHTFLIGSFHLGSKYLYLPFPLNFHYHYLSKMPFLQNDFIEPYTPFLLNPAVMPLSQFIYQTYLFNSPLNLCLTDAGLVTLQ